jgi:pimeloyl-ACP methyl ester carboxylesterase
MIGHFIHGHGPERALVLHGWFGDWQVFKPMLPALDQDRFSLAFMDYRGYGRSRALEGPFDIRTIALDAVQLVDSLGWESFSLVGHSMGGKVALRVAARSSKRIRRIVAITPVWAGRVPFDDQTLGMFRAAVGDVRVREAIISQTAGGSEPAVWARNMAAHSMEISRSEAFGGYLESWVTDDFESEVHHLKIPTRVIIGARDSSITREVVSSTWLTHLADVSLAVMAEVGHYPMLQAPLSLASLVESFLLPEAT